MKYSLIVLATLFSVAQLSQIKSYIKMQQTQNLVELSVQKNDDVDEYKEFAKSNGRKFDTEDETDTTSEFGKRYGLYKKVKAAIEDFNGNSANSAGYLKAVNKFADWTDDEIEGINGLKNKDDEAASLVAILGKPTTKSNTTNTTNTTNDTTTTWTAIDWTSSFGGIRDQGYCGSCWAFAVSGQLEASVNIKNGAVGSYRSAQQLVDCDTSSFGCNGGYMSTAFNYVKNTGLVINDDYPYYATAKTCSVSTANGVAQDVSYSYCYGTCTEQTVYNYLTKGPVVVGIDGSAIMYYSSGIFSSACSTYNHAVILIGYGTYTDSTGKSTEYWLVRNSWGTWWGESGYIRVKRDSTNNNSCYITYSAYQGYV